MHRIRRMGTALSLLLATLGASVTGAVADHKPPTKQEAVSESRDGWPDTKAGAIARRWVEAFSKGEKAMRAALPEIMSAQSLEKTTMDERIERYRGLHDKLGSLMLVKIDLQSPGELVAVLATSDLKQLPFTFKVQTTAPFKLISVSYAEQRFQHGGGFSH